MDEQVTELQREVRSSIEVDRNAKGDMSYKAKVYFDETDPTGRDSAQKKLVAIDQWFLAQWHGPPTI